MKIELLIGAVTVGLGATLVMDLWAILLKRAFNIPSPNYCLVGRWLRHMTNGTFKHPSIAAAAQKPAECTIGWIAHYTIRALFAIALVALATPQWLQSPTLMPALVFGIVTVGFPFFIMHRCSALALPRQRPQIPCRRGCVVL
jgi:hypothetical protein